MSDVLGTDYCINCNFGFIRTDILPKYCRGCSLPDVPSLLHYAYSVNRVTDRLSSISDLRSIIIIITFLFDLRRKEEVIKGRRRSRGGFYLFVLSLSSVHLKSSIVSWHYPWVPKPEGRVGRRQNRKRRDETTKLHSERHFSRKRSRSPLYLFASVPNELPRKGQGHLCRDSHGLGCAL